MTESVSLPARERKFRQAAFVYLHVGLLYEYTVYAFWQAGLVENVPGHPAVWLLAGAGIVAVVFWGLWSWRNRWFARVIWAIHGLRLPALIGGAFLRPAGEGRVPPELYQFAIVIIVINLWMLARAGWDL